MATESRIYYEIDFAAGTTQYTPVYQQRFVWRIRRKGNRERLVVSEVLNSHRACMEAINLVFQDAGKAKLVDKTKKS
jgi:uncharacterized protein YegP (UPF0339 family)